MEVTAVRAEGGKLVAERPILGDSAISEISFRSPVGIIIARLNAFEITQGGSGAAPVEDLAVEIAAFSTKASTKSALPPVDLSGVSLSWDLD